MSLINHLKNAGLGDKEAKVYLAMLELGPSSVLEIAAKAGVNRPTAYLQIELLKTKGLVSTQKKGKKDLYIAEGPDQLEKVLEEEVKSLEIKKGELKKALPELEDLFNLAEDKPIVRYFEGKTGLEKMQNEFLKCRAKEIYAVSSVDDVIKIFPNENKTYTQHRLDKGIKAKLIYTSDRGPFLSTDDKDVLRESKFVPKEKLPFSTDITIYDNKVAIASLHGKLGGIIIEDQPIADSFRSFFLLTWSLLS